MPGPPPAARTGRDAPLDYSPAARIGRAAAFLAGLAAAAEQAGDWARIVRLWAEIAALGGTDERDFAGVVEGIQWGTVRGRLFDAGAGDAVHVEVNGRRIASTVACQKRRGTTLGFGIRLTGLWRRLGGGDVLRIVDNVARPLELRGIGDRLTVTSGRPSKVDSVFAALDAGQVFNKWGHLQQPLTTDLAFTGGVMALFARAEALLGERFGYKLMVFYGTLLGAVRSGDFIHHDDDIDLLDVGELRAPDAVRAEFVAICRALAAEGFRVVAKPFGAKVRGATGTAEFGLHFGWFDEDGLNVAYGHNGVQFAPDPPVLGFRTARLGAHEVDVPDASEAILAMLYGEDWRVPDPGFSHHTKRRRNKPDFHLGEAEMAAASNG